MVVLLTISPVKKLLSKENLKAMHDGKALSIPYKQGLAHCIEGKKA
jgi:hypothetical protein